MMPTHGIVFLIDVDDTLLANDRIQDDIQRHLEREYGTEARERYWAIQEELFAQLGYRDYLGALQRYRVAPLPAPPEPDGLVPGGLPLRQPALSRCA
jgi:hypothetical protein